MSDMEVTRLLTELRALSARSPDAMRPQAPSAGATQGPGFTQSMVDAARNVNSAQQDARQAATDFELGRGDLATAMLRGQSASIQFQAMTQVRNKLVQAYQDVMNMSI